MLVVEGAIRAGAPTEGGLPRRSFSEAEILAMPTGTIVTATDWRPRTEFVGPPLAAVLKAAGAELTERSVIQLVALNDYAVSVPATDLDKYRPVLAHTVAGKRLSRREGGPLWLMYPKDSHDELRNNAASNHKLIWQVVRIVVH